MSVTTTQIRLEKKVLSNYLRELPLQVRSLFVPSDPRDQEQLAQALKELRIKEKERNYVLELQIKYGVPIRPNESVRQTMTRIRLSIMRQRAKKYGPFSKYRHAVLPSDPLE